MKSGDRLDTGTGPQRRRLTRAEAEAGCLPTPFTREEWRAMHLAALRAEDDALRSRLRGLQQARHGRVA